VAGILPEFQPGFWKSVKQKRGSNPMFKIRNYIFAATFSLFAFGWAGAAAQAIPADSPLADGEISQEEMAVILATAEQQLTRLVDAATQQYLPTIQGGGRMQPMAWMLMKDGETVKRINIDGQAEGAPPELRIVMYRAAIKSVAQRGLINAAAILYAGQVSDTDNTQALVVEHEHRLGVSGHKVVGFKQEQGEVVWGKPVTDKKPFDWFYSEKKGAS